MTISSAPNATSSTAPPNVPSAVVQPLPKLAPSLPAITTVKIEGKVPLDIQAKRLEGLDILLSSIPFLVTICVVLAAAALNYRVNKRTIENQDKNASYGRQADHQNKISEYRHAWIQEVRETGAELIKTVYEAQILLMQFNLTADYINASHSGPKVSNEKLEEWKARQPVIWLKEKEAAADLYRHVSKLKLLFQPNDPKVSTLFALLDDTIRKVGNKELRAVDDATIVSIVGELQVILKNEWEVTKAEIKFDASPLVKAARK